MWGAELTARKPVCSIQSGTCQAFALDFIKMLVFPGSLSTRALGPRHVTQHVALPQILLCTKGSLLGVHVCQNEACHQVNGVPLQALSIVITLTAKVFITHTQRCFRAARSAALTPGFSDVWGMCHDMGSLVWGNVLVSSNIWFHVRFRCLGWAACGCLWTF